MPDPEQAARVQIDDALDIAGWAVQDANAVNLSARRGVAVREFPLARGHGFADYLLYVDGQAVGVVEAKKQGGTLTGVELQTNKYSTGLPPHLPAPVRPLPFLYESTGVETRFTNRLDPEPRSRQVFTFHRPETLAGWIAPDATVTAAAGMLRSPRPTMRRRLQTLPPIAEQGLWPAQLQAVSNLEASLRDDRPRALIQMATGSGKTFTAISAVYRMIKFGGAQRVLFLVDRGNLGRQAYKEFQQYPTPDDGRKFTELYNVQHLQSNKLDKTSRVCISTVLRGDAELDPSLEEGSQFDESGRMIHAEQQVAYNPAIPIETFDVIIVDECHRSIYNLWRQVLEYFDAYLIGLTATPSKQTFGFFNQNLVMEYDRRRAVADGVNVDSDVYRIRTEITERGARVDAGAILDFRDRQTRKVRWQQLDEEFSYSANQLDRDVVALDQIRTVVQTFRDRLPTEIFPGRTHVPKTLIFAKDDSHAEDIVKIVREEFGKGNDFCQKITYKTTGAKPEDLLASFRNSYYPRIVVTVDMIATGTDIKPLEIVMFLRAVKSRIFFEQMLGRGVRVINPTDLQAVTPDAASKDHFVVVDCVGVFDTELVDAPPLERKPSLSLQTLLQAVAFGTTEPELLSSLAGRLARLDRQMGAGDRHELTATAQGVPLSVITARLVEALDPDRQAETARAAAGLPNDADPTPEQIAEAARTLLREAAAPLRENPALRQQILDLKKRFEQTIDTVTVDVLNEAGFDAEAREKAQALAASFEQFLQEHRDEITAWQTLYSRPYAQRLRLSDIRSLADAIKASPRAWTPERLWQAYQTLDAAKVRGSGQRILTDIVALVRYALHQDGELAPFPERVAERFEEWLAQQESRGRRFSQEQRLWLEMIRDHIAASLHIEVEDLQDMPFNQRGGANRAYQVFGEALYAVLNELNEVLVA